MDASGLIFGDELEPKLGKVSPTKILKPQGIWLTKKTPTFPQLHFPIIFHLFLLKKPNPFQLQPISSKLVKPAEPASASPTPPGHPASPNGFPSAHGAARPSRSYHGSSGFPPPTPCGRCWCPRAVRGTWYPSWRRLPYACVAGAVRALEGVGWKVMERCPKKKSWSF